MFTLLAAATRAAEGVAGPSGFLGQSKARAPEGLSEIIGSLPGETLGLSRGSELVSAGVKAEKDDEDDGTGASGRGAKGNNGGVGDAGGQSSLLSASSALVFVKEFVRWASAVKSSNSGVRPVEIITGGWDGGIGVWMGLTHSVRTLARVLKTDRDSSCSGYRNRKGGVLGEESTTKDNSIPSAEAVALAVFELRAVVGTPWAALRILDPSITSDTPLCSSTEHVPSSSSFPSSPSTSDASKIRNAEGSRGDADPCSHSLYCRPPPGIMIVGFLTKMSERWKAHIKWGLPSTAPSRRTSPRLEGDNRRLRGGSRKEGAESMVAEAEELFFALRIEMLRAERLALSILIVGPSATTTSRAWAMRAALDSAPRRVGKSEKVDSSVTAAAATPHSCASCTKISASEGPPNHVVVKISEDKPEARSGPARAPAVGTRVRAKNHFASRRGRVLTVSKGGVATQEEKNGRRWGRKTGKEGAVVEGDCCPIGSRRQNLNGVVEAKVVGCERGEEVGWDGLGTLCCLAAVEMREGLESGLSVKLSQVFVCTRRQICEACC